MGRRTTRKPLSSKKRKRSEKKKAKTDNPLRRTSKHHRKAKANGGENDFENLSFVTPQQHKAYNLLFGGDATPDEIARILNEVWIDPEYTLVVIHS